MRLRLPLLDRYLARQFFGPFFLAVGGFVIIGLVDILFTLVDLFVNSGVDFLTIFRLLLYKVPAIMVLFFPMAALFAVMLLLVRMAKDNEITVLRASGVHAGRILLPIIIFAALVSYLSYFVNETVVPWTNNVSDQLIQTQIEKRPPPTIVEQVFFTDEDGRYFYVGSMDKARATMRAILIYEVGPNFPKFISAETARWNNKTWQLYNGQMADFDEFGQVKATAHFDQMDIHVDRDLQAFYTKQKGAQQMDSSELKSQIDFLSKGGLSTRRLRVEYYMKQSIPASCLVFALIGIAYCLAFVRSGKDWWGVIVAVCVSVLTVGFFFFLIAVFRSLGFKGILDPFWAAWLPDLLYGGIASAAIFYQAFFR